MWKKTVSLVVALGMALTLAACGGGGGNDGDQAQVDLAAFYDTMFAQAKEEGLAMTATEGDMLEMLYPGLSDVECNQLVAYAPMMSAVAYEVALVEVANSDDVDTVKEIFQNRIDTQSTDGPGMYPATVEQWQKNAYVESNGNYVMLVVGEGADAEVTAFQNLFQQS